MTTEYDKPIRILQFFWYGVTLAAVPMIAVAVGLGTLFEALPEAVYVVDVPQPAAWAIVLGLMGIGVLAGKLAGQKFLTPAQMARRSVQGQPKSVQDGAEMRVKQAMFIQLSLYETPAILLIGYTLMAAEPQWVIAGAVYMVAVGVLAKPQFLNLLQDTQRELERLGSW